MTGKRKTTPALNWILWDFVDVDRFGKHVGKLHHSCLSTSSVSFQAGVWALGGFLWLRGFGVDVTIGYELLWGFAASGSWCGGEMWWCGWIGFIIDEQRWGKGNVVKMRMGNGIFGLSKAVVRSDPHTWLTINVFGSNQFPSVYLTQAFLQ